MKSLKNKIQLKIKIPKQNNPQDEKTNTKNINNNRNTISQITDNIYISGYIIGQNLSYLKDNNFTHVINCSLGSSIINPQNEISAKFEFQKAGIKYLSLYLRDIPEIDIIAHLFTIINFIESDKEINCKKILFHCIEGISRAPAMAAGYLIWKENMSSSNAIELIKSKRQCVEINLGFNIQLNKWNNYLNSSPKQIHIFKLSPNIRLLEEEEMETYTKESYLVKMRNRLFYINRIYNNDEDEYLTNYKINKTKENYYPIFNVVEDKTKELIKNVIKYDKTLLKNDFSSLVEIR